MSNKNKNQKIFRAWCEKERRYYYDGDLFTNPRSNREHPAIITDKGIYHLVSPPQEQLDDYITITKEGKRRTYYSNWGYNLLRNGYITEQSIGRVDINRKPIFEGDIIQAMITQHPRVETQGWVVYDSQQCCFCNKNEAGLTPLYFLESIKIIGNIHEPINTKG